VQLLLCPLGQYTFRDYGREFPAQDWALPPLRLLIIARTAPHAPYRASGLVRMTLTDLRRTR
jgi:hypothetical protein